MLQKAAVEAAVVVEAAEVAEGAAEVVEGAAEVAEVVEEVAEVVVPLLHLQEHPPPWPEHHRDPMV